MTSYLRRVWCGERGASLVEMAILLVLIAVVALIAVKYLGDSNSEMWSEIGSGLTQT